MVSHAHSGAESQQHLLFLLWRFHLVLVTQTLQQGGSSRRSMPKHPRGGFIEAAAAPLWTGWDEGGPCGSSLWLRFYLWVTWLLRRPGNVCSDSELSDPPGGQCESESGSADKYLFNVLTATNGCRLTHDREEAVPLWQLYIQTRWPS